jgi:hypothetical protein
VSAIPSAVPEDGLFHRLRPCDVVDLATRELVDSVVESGYVGVPWEELARRLVERALPDLQRVIRTGAVYRRCGRAGYRIVERRELQRWPLCDDIAAEAVEECLARFRNVVLPAGEWDPSRGTSLEDFTAIDMAVEDFVSPLDPTGAGVKVSGVGFPADTLAVGTASRSRVDAFGLEWSNEGKNAFSAPFAWSG